MSPQVCGCVLEMIWLISFYVWIVGGLYFVGVCLIGIFISFFFRQETIDPLLKKMLRLLFPLIRVPVRVEGAGKIDRGGTYLFMANHSSLFDIPVFEAFIPVFVRGIEADRQFKWPVYGWAIRKVGNIPISRENIHASIRSMKKGAEHLKKGKSLLVLPEGHRTLDGNLRPFKKLPFHLAKQAEAPIIPIGLSGLFQLKHKGSWLIRPRPITVRFGDPIGSEVLRSLSVEELRDRVRDRIQDLIEDEDSSAGRAEEVED